MREYQHIDHELPPYVPSGARVLILGTMPSPKSREVGFYYGHPQNRFWKALSGAFGENVPVSTEEQKAFLERHKIALWDTLASCEIHGADDASIRRPVANDLQPILSTQPIQAIFTTGKKAADYYERLILPNTGIPATTLPSPSPANCRYHTVETQTEAYRAVCRYCP